MMIEIAAIVGVSACGLLLALLLATIKPIDYCKECAGNRRIVYSEPYPIREGLLSSRVKIGGVWRVLENNEYIKICERCKGTGFEPKDRV